MRDRAPESAEMIDSMEDEHRRLHSAQARADAIVAEWSETGVGNRSEECAALASELVELLAAHSNREETELLPMVPGVITVEEWAQLPEHAQRNARPEDLPFVLGMIMEVMPVEARGFMLASLPEPVQQAWDAYGSAAFAAHDAEVRRLAGE